MHRFSKILIGNRGEIARRIIRTTKQMGIKSLAICSQYDCQSNYIHEADEAITVEGDDNVFIDAKRLISIAKDNGADAIHPGYGFISENPEFSKLCEDSGIKFIGPRSSTMQLLSSKKDAKNLAIRAGIPVVPGYNGSDQSVSKLIEEIRKIDYPVLLKATMGGGGRGMRVLSSDSNIKQMIEMCSNEAKNHFGDGSLIVEKYLPRTRHIEIQVFGDKEGNVVHFGERECSLQRNYQKIIEEAPCFYLSDEERNRLYGWAKQLIRDSHYEGAGTVEFLCDASSRQFYFMEVNTRLQVEHLVSQCINHQLDLVELQIRIAQGETIPEIGVSDYLTPSQVTRVLPTIYKKGGNCGNYAMECRVYNEDPNNNFLPGDGVCTFVNNVTDHDHTIIENNITPSEKGKHSVSFDPMLLKVITSGDSRLEVIERMENALRRCAIYGIPTNIQFLVNSLRMQKFRDYGADSQTIKEESDLLMGVSKLTDVEICNSIGSYLFYDQSVTKSVPNNGPWNELSTFCNTGSMKRMEYLVVNDKSYECQVETDPTNLNSYVIRVKNDKNDKKVWNEPISVEFLKKEGNELTLCVNHQVVKSFVYDNAVTGLHVFPVSSIDCFHDVQYTVKMDSLCGKKETTNVADSVSDVLCPMPSTITAINVKNGDHVKKGDVLLVIEAMKMEHIITAPHDGVVEMNQLEEKQFIKKGQPMLRVV